MVFTYSKAQQHMLERFSAFYRTHGLQELEFEHPQSKFSTYIRTSGPSTVALERSPAFLVLKALWLSIVESF